MRFGLETTPEEMDHYRRIASESYPITREVDEAILLIGALIQNAIDRARGLDSVQLSLEFSQKSRSNPDSDDANLRKARKHKPISARADKRLEP